MTAAATTEPLDNAPAGTQDPEADPAEIEAFKARLRAANISDQSFLATDYLNHFNEVVMLLQLVPDMPDMLEEVVAWRPKSYPEHFRDSVFHDRDLAIEAYHRAPASSREAFDATVADLNDLVAKTLAVLTPLVAAQDQTRMALACDEAVAGLGRLVEVASAIIHGDYSTSAQGEIDRLIAEL